jgi:uncharacterized membrane protein
MSKSSAVTTSDHRTLDGTSLLKLLLKGVSFLNLIKLLLDVIAWVLGRLIMVLLTSHSFLPLHAFFMYSSFFF